MAVPAIHGCLVLAQRALEIVEHTQVVDRVDIASNCQRKGANVGAACRITRKQLRLALDLIEVFDDRKRLGDDAAGVLERWHQPLRVKSAIGRRIVLPAIPEEVHLHRLIGEPLEIEGNSAAVGGGGAEVAVDNKNVWSNTFINKMEFAFAAADVVISRAGAMAIAELCVVKKPVVFVPYPFAAEDHQTVKAQNLVAKHAGIMIKDSEAKDKLVNEIVSLAKDAQLQNELKANIGKLGVKNADEVIAKAILENIGR